MTRYPVHRLGEFLRIKHGHAFKGEFFASAGEYVLLTPGNFSASDGLKSKGEREKYYVGPFPREYLLARGDLIVALTDLTQDAPILGAPAVVPESGRYLHNQRLGKVQLLNAGLDARYLYYLLQHHDVRSQIRASATGATVRHTAPERIYRVEAPVPPLAVQVRTAAILKAYDDLIENNARRMAILEETCQALYREWFVAPGAGARPGWRSVALSEVVQVNPRTFVPKTGRKPFVPMTSLRPRGMCVVDVEAREGNSGSKFKNGDTLLARISPCIENGKTGFVQFLGDDEAVAFGSTEFIVLRGASISPEMVYLLARTDELRAHAISSMVGATGRQRVPDGCFDAFRTLLPPRDVIDRFTGIVRPMFRGIHVLAMASENLRRTRGLLVPGLVPGAGVAAGGSRPAG
jgi:type I restriction enzyme S subunit